MGWVLCSQPLFSVFSPGSVTLVSPPLHSLREAFPNGLLGATPSHVLFPSPIFLPYRTYRYLIYYVSELFSRLNHFSAGKGSRQTNI